jgi:PhoPQ-activated pathogenicity-related protein
MIRFSPGIGICLLSFIFLFSAVQAQTTITPATALDHYLNNGDKSYQWKIRDSATIGNVSVYGLLLTSQKWREYTWTHQLSILVPKEIKHDGALLFITGGSINKEGLPHWNGKEDALIQSFSQWPKKNNAVVAV